MQMEKQGKAPREIRAAIDAIVLVVRGGSSSAAEFRGSRPPEGEMLPRGV
jgi:hypothetical protein